MSTRGNKLNVSTAIRMTEYMTKETEYVPWDVFFQHANNLQKHLPGSSKAYKYLMVCILSFLFCLVWRQDGSYSSSVIEDDRADYLQLTAGGGVLLLHTHFLLHSNIFFTQHSTYQLIFMEGGKPENPEKNPRRERINNKLNSYMTPNPESNPGHSGERRAPSPLRHPCARHPCVRRPCVRHPCFSCLSRKKYRIFSYP
jgi:hypothetical protein